ncbi:hypothetical protein NDU88_006868, partial [Pleurodeles waltl]
MHGVYGQRVITLSCGPCIQRLPECRRLYVRTLKMERGLRPDPIERFGSPIIDRRWRAP